MHIGENVWNVDADEKIARVFESDGEGKDVDVGNDGEEDWTYD